MIAKNGLNWNAMGFTVYGECPKYKSTLHKTSKNHRNKDKNISCALPEKIDSKKLQKTE